MTMKQGDDLNAIKKQVSSYKLETVHQTARRDAAVLVPLIQEEDGIHILFQVRGSSISQAGEVSFPGGRVEEGEDTATAAVRETIEEMLLREDQVSLLAPLFRLIGPGSRHIYSYLGELHDYDGSFSAEEVERVFTVPLAYFFTHEPKIYPVSYEAKFPADFPFHLIDGGENYNWDTISRNIYFYEVNGEIIWGLTAEILYETVQRLSR